MKDEERRQLKVEGVLSFLVLTGRGFTFSNRIESPYYIGQGKKLRNRLWGHAKRVGGPLLQLLELFLGPRFR